MSARLHAALHLHAVLPALGVLAPRDPSLGKLLDLSDLSVVLSTPGLAPTRIARRAGRLTVDHPDTSAPGDLHLFFPTRGQLVRACERRPAAVLPLRGWTQIGAGRHLLETAGARLETVLTDRATVRADAAMARLHVPVALTVAVAGAAVWLREHAEGPAFRARFAGRLIRFSAVDPEFSIWLDLGGQQPHWGLGAPPRAADAAVTFTDLATAVGELLHENDSLAALGLGTLRITGLLPLAEQIGLLMQHVDQLLQPATHAH